MIELPVTLTSTGGAVSFASPVTLGYTKNKGVYRLLVTAEGEWQGLIIRCFWHLPGGTDPASNLVQDGAVDVPASVTAQPGTGCITFEGSDGVKTVTSADLRYRVGSNSGTEDGTMPEPGTPAWEQLVSETKANADAAEQAKNDAQAAAESVKTAAAKAEEAASAAEKSAQKAEEAAERSTQAGIAASNAADDAKWSAGIATGAAGDSALNAENAQKRALSAQQSAENAAESQSAAQASADAAEKSQQSAATDAKTANDAKTAAAGSADDAAGSAVAAGNSASAAAGSEQAAGASEVKAAESEKAAKASEQDAAKSAQAALESKTAAETSEGNAAASAKKAQDVADSLPADYMTAVNEIAALKINKADKADLETVRKQIGNLDDLTTKAKETLVAAINEAARTGAAMRTDGGYIQYSTDDGSTWENLIALAELKGEPGQNGADGYSPTASVEQSTDGAKITITDKSGTTEAAVKNGKDGANGRDGTDGAPGRDGVDGQPGKDGTDGITPTIGDNGNWFLGATDTGKPSRGATGDTGTDGNDAPQIDDTAITTTNPWSSKQIVDMLCPPLEESGNPVVCYPVAGYPLGVKAKWEPVQEGSGAPSQENIRPIKGRDSVTITRQEDNQVITLTLPETAYGGEVDAVTGEGQDTRKHVILNGTESWNTWGINANNPAVTGFYTYVINDYDAINAKGICSHLANPSEDTWGGRNAGIGFATGGNSKYFIYSMPTSLLHDISAGHEVDSLKSYFTAQNAAGTPVQIAYKLATPTPFTATGAQPIPALAGANTVLTDADNVTVTGRADPIKRIADLENKE